MLQQVDDFLILCELEVVAKCMCDHIDKKLMVQKETAPPFQHIGPAKHCDGVDLLN